jgi:hypothetical protein
MKIFGFKKNEKFDTDQGRNTPRKRGDKWHLKDRIVGSIRIVGESRKVKT